MSSRSKCIYYTVVALSSVISLRTYRVLYCGIFKGVAPYGIKKVIDMEKRIQDSKIAN